MIATIRQQLLIMNKADCEHSSLSYQEKGKGVKLTPSKNGEAIKIRVDDQSKNNGESGLISEGSRCDCLYFYQQPSLRHVLLVELKGNNYEKALSQLHATKEHPDYKVLLKVVDNQPKIFSSKLPKLEQTAVAILASKAQTNRPRKDEWENTNNIRLRVERIKDDETFDLRSLIKEMSSIEN